MYHVCWLGSHLILRKHKHKSTDAFTFIYLPSSFISFLTVSLGLGRSSVPFVCAFSRYSQQRRIERSHRSTCLIPCPCSEVVTWHSAQYLTTSSLIALPLPLLPQFCHHHSVLYPLAMLCEECLQPFRGIRPPGYKQPFTGPWTQGYIEELQECFVCIWIWRCISESRERTASTESTQYNVVRDLRVRERTSENMSQGIWALYHIEIVGDGMPNNSGTVFSVKSLSGKFQWIVKYIKMLI